MRAAVRAVLFLVWLQSTLAQAQIANFKHIVIIVQENRTPDNLFQGLCVPPFGSSASCSVNPNPTQYDILTNNWTDKYAPGGKIHPLPVTLAGTYDLSHTHAAFLAMCDLDSSRNACRMDGAAGVTCSGGCLSQPQFRFVDNSTGIMNPYLRLATQYGWANYMFQTNQGPSFPAHQFVFGGTSAPSDADDRLGIFIAENMAGGHAGCAAPAGTTVALIQPGGDESVEVYPCTEHPTLVDLLPPAVTWRYYTPSAGSIWTAPNAIQHICQSTGKGGICDGLAWRDNVDLTPADILTDVSDCRLRSLSWVIPTGLNSDHSQTSDGGGPSWVAAIVNAIGNSKSCDGNTGYWNDTAILVTWDDWGGWYDHVPPKILSYPQGDYQYGFRVPLLFISAYTRKGLINNLTHDFGTILRFVEHNFGIGEGSLSFADARADNNLSGFYDLNSRPRSFQTVPAQKDASFFLGDKRPVTDPDDDQ